MMNEISELLELGPYSLSSENKKERFNVILKKLTLHHYQSCLEYRKMLNASNIDIDSLPSYEFLPYLPVRLFKELDLFSIASDDIVKTMMSSGTSGQKVSKIYLNKETASNQTKVLTKVVSSFIGNKRIPMLILDSSDVVNNRAMFSARGAGVLGFSMFGSRRLYALNDKMNLNVNELDIFLNENKEQPIFIFGFTFIIWQHFYKELIKIGYKPDLSSAILIHGGGWKKLINESVSSDLFKKSLFDACGINNVYDYYGMVEQSGSIYMECEQGNLHASIFSDIVIRRPAYFSIAEIGEVGIIQIT
jgi:phenylacetate-coenzyme A ligase PaaK-like adenylate-forming protein